MTGAEMSEQTLPALITHDSNSGGTVPVLRPACADPPPTSSEGLLNGAAMTVTMITGTRNTIPSTSASEVFFTAYTFPSLRLAGDAACVPSPVIPARISIRSGGDPLRRTPIRPVRSPPGGVLFVWLAAFNPAEKPFREPLRGRVTAAVDRGVGVRLVRSQERVRRHLHCLRGQLIGLGQ